jgi:hypothetical protein
MIPGWAKIIEKVESKLFELLGSHLFTKQTVRDVIWGKPVPALKFLKDLLKLLGFDFDIPESVGLFAGVSSISVTRQLST